MAESKYFHTLSYVLSRLAFAGTHFVAVYWLNFLLNDPFNLGTATLDFKQIKPADQCTPLIKENLIHDLVLFSFWWGTHSGFARKAYKQAVGLWDHPLERPLFAFVAWIVWFTTIHYWRPITDCSRWDPFQVSLGVWALSAVVIALALFLLLGFLWVLPDHVFGTGKYRYPQGQSPKHGDIIRGFPYGLVRHPAATAFLWSYWALPAYTPNHIFLASLWTVFIVVGTLVFEEGGLRGEGEFGRKYNDYAKEVHAFYPTPSAIQQTFFGQSKKQL